ncbi:MAG TPA: TRAP transporter substrate-binding protein [Chromatiales bacterium]|nr:TRAP transporter substrate-binding protein [Chromatiales bacterium]
MNRIVSRSVVLCAVLLLGACAQQDSGVEVVNMAGTATPGTPGEAMWLNFKRDAEAAAGGQLKLRALIHGQLGSEEKLLSGLRRGRIQFANLSAQVVSTLVPELSVLYAPYLFESTDEADFVYDHYLTDRFRELLAEHGLYLVTWYEIGFHSIYAREPLIVPADAAGRRFRVSSALSSRLFAEALHADVIPLGFGDIVPSLQTGLIDAGENSVSLYARTGIAAEAPHYTLTRHLFGVSVIVASKRWWDALDPKLRKIMADTFPSVDESRAASRAQELRDLNDPALGIQVHELSEAQRELWKAAVKDVTPELIQRLGGHSAEILDLIQQGKRAWTEQKRPARD